MNFSFNDNELMNALHKLPLSSTSKYGDIISMSDINNLVSLYSNNYELLKSHLLEAEQRSLLKIIRAEFDTNLFYGITFI